MFTELHPCLSATALSQIPQLRPYVNAFPALISAPQAVYRTLYQTTLHRVLELCQALPFNREPLQPYGLVTQQCQLTIQALKLRRGVMLPRHAHAEIIAQQDPLWTYALFSLGLVQGLDRYFSRLTLELYKTETERLGRWTWLTGTLAEPATFYRLIPTEQPLPEEATRRLEWAIVLGRLLPSLGWRWLASDAQLFQAWWECLFDSASLANPLQELLVRAKSLAFEKTATTQK